MSILNLKPTWEVPQGATCILSAGADGIYVYADIADPENPLYSERHAFETMPWPELYRYDDTARDEFLRQRWERLLESV